MRWEDERYIRFYTRDTPEFLALSWVARGLFGLILRKVDRAGILAVGKLGLRGVAVAVGGPWTEVEAPLRELIEDGCIVVRDGLVIIPNFQEAQEARQSDKARAAKAREKARVDATEASQNVTRESQAVTAASRIVTKSHAGSHGVTPSHTASLRAVPCSAEPCRAEPENTHSAGAREHTREEPTPEPPAPPPRPEPVPLAKLGGPVGAVVGELGDLAATLRAEGSGLGEAVCEKLAEGKMPTPRQMETLRKIRDERARPSQPGLPGVARGRAPPRPAISMQESAGEGQHKWGGWEDV